MAKVINTKARLPAKGLPMKRKPGVGLGLQVSLPEEPTELSSDIREYSILLHGEKKIGKTSLFAQEPGAIFLEWDPEQKALPIYQRQIPDWPHFLAYLKLLESGKHDFKTVIVDGVDIMYQACFKHMCKQLGIEHPHDEKDFGKSWSKIKAEFGSAVDRLLILPDMATRFIAHSAWKEINTRTGGTVEKLVPMLTGQAEEALVGKVDLWAAYVYDGKDRVLVVKGNETTGAGHRIDHCLRTPRGEMIEEIPMGKSAKEAYSNLIRAFENKQTMVRIEAEPKTEPKAKKKFVLKKKS